MLNKKIILLLLIFAFCGTCLAYRGNKARSRSCTAPASNANIYYNRRGSYLFVGCNYPARLFGSRVIQCLNGKWVDPKPVCAKSGCSNVFPQPQYGNIIMKTYELEIICPETHMLAGNRIAYCNGTDWDRPLGECRLKTTTTSHECDFETEDLCGWFAESVESHQWNRKIAINVFGSFSTGPTHDHTTMSANGGHYMLMESFKMEGIHVPLISPIYDRNLSLKTACCFRFYYFMYGQGVGDLSVYIKPASLIWENVLDNNEYLKFNKSGSQEMAWKEAIFDIPEMQEDFQIVFVATSSRSHLSDIAIDDVKLMIGSECPNSEVSTTENQDTTETVEAIYDVESCQNRCFKTSISALENRNESLYLLCSCHLGCSPNCCPDYHTECLGSLFEMMNIPLETTSTNQPTTTTSTTTTRSTTTPKPTTTTTIRTTMTTTSSTTKATPKTSTTVTTTFPKIPTITTTTTTAAKTTTTTRRTTTTTATTPKTTTIRATTKEIKKNTTTSSTLEPITTTTPAKNVKIIDSKPSNTKTNSWKYEPKVDNNRWQKYQLLEIILVLLGLSIILVGIISRVRHNIKDVYESWISRVDTQTSQSNKNNDDAINSRVRFSNKNHNNSINMKLPLIEADAEDSYL